MNSKQIKAGAEIIPNSFFTRMGLALVFFFVAAAAAWQVSLYFYTRTVLEFHYRAVLLKLAMIREEIFFKSLMVSLAFFIVPCVLVAFFLVIYSHRLAGPMFRVRQYLQSIAGKDTAADLGLREKDALHPLARTINDVRHRERDDLARVAACLAGAEELLGRDEELGPLLEGVERCCAECAEILEEVRL